MHRREAGSAGAAVSGSGPGPARTARPALQSRSRSLWGPPAAGFRAAGPCVTRTMTNPDTPNDEILPFPLEELLIYEDDEVVFDGADPRTYVTLEDWARELGGATDGIVVSSNADLGL